jgi:outer membrane protein
MRFFLAAVLLASSLLAHAEGKIAVVDFEKAIFNTAKVQAKVQQLQSDAEYKKNMEEIRSITTEGKRLTEKYQKELPTMSAQQKQKAETDLKGLQSDMEHVARKLKEAEESTIKPLMYEMQAQALNAAKEIIKTEGIGLLINGNPQLVLHADTSFDITAKVTDRLNKMGGAKPAAPAKAAPAKK